MEQVAEKLPFEIYLTDIHSNRVNARDKRYADPDRVTREITQLEAAIAKARLAGFVWVADKADTHWRNGNPGRARALLRSLG